MPFSEIVTDRLIIKEYTDEYINDLYEYRSDQRVNKFYSIIPDNKEELKSYIHNNITEFNRPNGYSLFVVTDKGKCIGDIAVKSWGFENKINAIGYAINPTYQCKGYAYESVKALLHFMFTEMNRNRFQASIDPDNIASIYLLHKLGFTKEGYLREVEYSDGKWRDEYIYAIIRSDWDKNQ